MPRGTVLVRSKNKSFSFFKLVGSKGKAFGCYVDRLPKTPPFKGRRFHYQDNLYQNFMHSKKATRKIRVAFSICVGTALSSQAVARQVFSTLMSLTSVFGMGTGGSSSPLAPTIYFRVLYPQNRTMKTCFVKDHPTLGQALDRLVLPSSMPHDTYTCSLSTL